MDKISKEQRSRNMSKVKGKNTKLEVRVRKYLYTHGIRYRINYKITGKPDIAIPSKKVAIFVNGCFWHCHSCKKGTTLPVANADFWKQKLDRNKQRDIEVEELLTREGWKVYKLWECELKDDFEETLNSLLFEINDRKLLK